MNWWVTELGFGWGEKVEEGWEGCAGSVWWMMNVKFSVFPGSGWCLKGWRGRLEAGRGVIVPSCWGGYPESLSSSPSLSVSDRLSFSPAHTQAIQPAAITTPQPLCHSNAMQSTQSMGAGRGRESRGGMRGVNEESRRSYPCELELDWQPNDDWREENAKSTPERFCPLIWSNYILCMHFNSQIDKCLIGRKTGISFL